MIRQDEDGDSLWFPSLTNMMLAIAESLETVGTIWPAPSIEDYGTNKYHEKIQKQWQVMKAIAQKYGSPTGMILTN